MRLAYKIRKRENRGFRLRFRTIGLVYGEIGVCKKCTAPAGMAVQQVSYLQRKRGFFNHNVFEQLNKTLVNNTTKYR